MRKDMITGARRRAGLIGLLVLVAALMAIAGVPEAGYAQDDCTEDCWDGWWDEDFWWCIPETPRDCTECTVTCPGGGSIGPFYRTA